MSDILSSIGNAITLAKRLNEISNNIKDAELKNVLADLSLELADTKLKLAKIITDNADLKERNHKLSTEKFEKKDLFFRDGLYYIENDEHPFCPSCYDSKRMNIRLKNINGTTLLERKMGNLNCPICKNYYIKK